MQVMIDAQNKREELQHGTLLSWRSGKCCYFERILKQCCYLYSSNLVKISIHEGVIVSCGMEVAYNNYLMFAASQDSLIIDRFVAYSWQKLSLLTVTK